MIATATRKGPMVATSLQTELARQILDLAKDEGWAAGTRIPEQALAERLGVSRTPVGKALKFLAGHGILVPVAPRGYALAKPVDRAVRQAVPLPPSEIESLFARIMLDRARGELAQEVSESELSERYGAPRGTVRKVLLRFARDGLAERLRGHGWRFADTLDDEAAVDESYVFRLATECAALRAPGYRVDRARLEALRRAHLDLLARAGEAITREEWFDVNAAFHEAVAAWSHNRFFLQAVRTQNSLRRMQEYSTFEELGAERIRTSCEEHLAVLDSLDKGDLEFAEALLRRHIARAASYSREG